MTCGARVFVVQHVHTHEDGRDDVKLIGVSSSEARALQAVARLSLQPGFRDLPEGFAVDPYDLDVDHWTEGYFTADGP